MPQTARIRGYWARTAAELFQPSKILRRLGLGCSMSLRVKAKLYTKRNSITPQLPNKVCKQHQLVLAQPLCICPLIYLCSHSVNMQGNGHLNLLPWKQNKSAKITLGIDENAPNDLSPTGNVKIYVNTTLYTLPRETVRFASEGRKVKDGLRYQQGIFENSVDFPGYKPPPLPPREVVGPRLLSHTVSHLRCPPRR